MKKGKKGRSQILDWTYPRGGGGGGGGGHSDAYCVQQGGWGALKNQGKVHM